MMLDCKIAMSDRTGDTKQLALINSSAWFSFMSSSLAKCLGWVLKPNNTLDLVKLAIGIVVYNSGVATRLVSSGVWQAYIIFLVLNITFDLILGILWLLHIYS